MQKSDYDPFTSSGNRFRTNRQQRLRQSESVDKRIEMPKPQNQQKASIYFPGEGVNEAREKDKYAGFQRDQLNKSQNIATDYRSQIDDSPKMRELRIKEALVDHSREAAEQTRYFSRLEKSNRRQKVLFAEHYNKYIVPSAVMITAKKQQELQRMQEAKKRMEQIEIEQDNNTYTLKKEYNEYLKNQMNEKQRLKEQAKEAKKRMHDHIEYKRKMYEDEVLQNKIEKKREQSELMNILNNQTIYKYMAPARELAIKPYVDKFETNEPDKLFTLGGFEFKEGGLAQKKSRRQNNYIPPNPIVNPINDYNIYFRKHINENKHKYASGGLSKSVLGTTAAHNLSY